MTRKTSYLTIKEFVISGVLNTSGLEYTINNSVFIKRESIEFYRLTEVLNICREYNSFDLDVLVVRSKEHLTIWIKDEYKSFDDPDAQVNNDNQEIEQDYQLTPAETVVKTYRGQVYETEKIIVPHHQSIPTKKIVRTYRGRMYEEKIVDWSKIQPTNQPKKARRKYRGQYVD